MLLNIKFLSSFQICFEDYNLIIGVMQTNGNHWIVAAIYPKQQQMALLDPMSLLTVHQERDICDNLQYVYPFETLFNFHFNSSCLYAIICYASNNCTGVDANWLSRNVAFGFLYYINVAFDRFQGLC